MRSSTHFCVTVSAIVGVTAFGMFCFTVRAFPGGGIRIEGPCGIRVEAQLGTQLTPDKSIPTSNGR